MDLSKNFEDEISSNYRRFCLINEEKAKTFFNKIRADCLKVYSSNMEKAFNNTKSHFKECDLQKLHVKAKDESLQSVCSISYYVHTKQNSSTTKKYEIILNYFYLF